jgi:hypothetical protein
MRAADGTSITFKRSLFVLRGNALIESHLFSVSKLVNFASLLKSLESLGPAYRQMSIAKTKGNGPAIAPSLALSLLQDTLVETRNVLRPDRNVPTDHFDALSATRRYDRVGSVAMGGIGYLPMQEREFVFPSGEQAKNGYHGHHEHQSIQDQQDQEIAMATARVVPLVPSRGRQLFEIRPTVDSIWTPVIAVSGLNSP